MILVAACLDNFNDFCIFLVSFIS